MNSEASWNVSTTMNAWVAAGDFNDAYLGNLWEKYVGVACSCDPAQGVVCGFIFTDVYIGNLVSDNFPIFLPYSTAAVCSGYTPA